jgi:hypothetical protein
MLRESRTLPSAAEPQEEEENAAGAGRLACENSNSRTQRRFPLFCSTTYRRHHGRCAVLGSPSFYGQHLPAATARRRDDVAFPIGRAAQELQGLVGGAHRATARPRPDARRVGGPVDGGVSAHGLGAQGRVGPGLRAGPRDQGRVDRGLERRGALHHLLRARGPGVPAFASGARRRQMPPLLLLLPAPGVRVASCAAAILAALHGDGLPQWTRMAGPADGRAGVGLRASRQRL